jgi:Zn-dependent protease
MDNQTPPEDSDRYAAELQEMHNLQNQTSSWSGVVMMLVVSMALFVGTGSASWSLEHATTLILLMLLHESGHFVAMKLSGYRNLKMFFIPFFGAAVSGRSYNIPGWKKAVVSLAGPVPGILFGTALGIAGIALKITWMINAAVLCLILNGMNLLPLLPLDGGRVVQELFFARHYAFDVGFRVLTACIAAALAVMFGDWFFGFLGFLTAIGIPTALRSGRIVHALHNEGIQCDSETDDIPKELAIRIMDEVNRTFPPQGLTPKLKAQTTLGIFESLNSHAPGIGATLALAWIHAASFIGASVMIIVLMIGQQKLTYPDSGPGLPSEPESAERP